MATPDITIRGAGIFGLSVAHACLKRGAQVRVVDPDGVAAQASGGIVGALAPHTPEDWNVKKAFQFESLVRARTFWPEIEALSGLATGYVAMGRLQPVLNAKGLERSLGRVISARGLWGDAAIWEVRETTGAPWEPKSPTGQVIYDTLSAHLHPRQATNALAQAVLNLGGEIVTDAPDVGAVVWATGVAGLLDLAEALGVEMGRGEKGQAALLRYDAGRAPQLFADALHVIPHLDGTVAIGSTSERYYDEGTETDGLLDDVVARAWAAFPVLADAPVIERWAGARPRSVTRAPLLGAWPDRPGHFITNGGFKIGFGMAPKVGEVMADLVLEGRVTYPAAFDVQASL